MQYRAILVSIDGGTLTEPVRSTVSRGRNAGASGRIMEELASAKRSHNAHKGLFGQRIKAFESRVASFKRSPEVPQNWAEVEDAFDKVKLSYDRLQNAYTEVIIMEHDPGLETQNQAYYTSMEECSNEFLKAAEAKNKDKVLETGDREDMKRQALTRFSISRKSREEMVNFFLSRAGELNVHFSRCSRLSRF